MLTLDPAGIVFADLAVKLQTVISFEEGSGRVRYDRHILEMSAPSAEVTINEYMVGCYGTTEYTEDMTSLTLHVEGAGGTETLPYEYKCRELSAKGVARVACTLPPIKTEVSMECEGCGNRGYVREGYAFSPMFTLGYTGELHEKEVFTTWLRLERAG